MTGRPSRFLALGWLGVGLAAVAVSAAGFAPAGVAGPLQAVPRPETYLPVRLAAIFGPNPRVAPEEVDAAVVTPDFFPPRLNPIVGRYFNATDGRDREFQPAVISYGLYYSRFGGDMDAIGSPALVGGQRLSIVGVAPQGFGPADSGWLWLPPYRPAGEPDTLERASSIDGEWDVTLEREGAVMWPVGEPERQLASNVRGRLTLASVAASACSGCVALIGTIRVPFDELLPAGPPATLRLLPERRAGDTSRAVSGMVFPNGRLQVRTASGNCQLCGEILIEANLFDRTASGSWTLETAAVARSGDRGTVALQRVRTLAGGGSSARPLRR